MKTLKECSNDPLSSGSEAAVILEKQRQLPCSHRPLKVFQEPQSLKELARKSSWNQGELTQNIFGICLLTNIKSDRFNQAIG